MAFEARLGRATDRLHRPMTNSMWFENLPSNASWSALWYGYTICGECDGIRKTVGACPVCGSIPVAQTMPRIRLEDGREVEVSPVSMGAEGRYEDWVYLKMLESEWKRPLSESDRLLDVSGPHRPSARAVIAIVFWSYFETRIERLLRQSMRGMSRAVADDLLRRYASIGARLDRLYHILFDASYWSDLEDAGFQHVSVMLKSLHDKRNRFTHGSPEAIDDRIVTEIVSTLKDEHESWIAVFNRRATSVSRRRV